MTKERIFNIIDAAEQTLAKARSKYPGRAIRDIKEIIAEDIFKELDEEKEPRYLMVEDGSIDVEDLEEKVKGENIKIIIYRHGTIIPKFLET